MKNTKNLALRLREVILNGKWIANTNYKNEIEHLDWKDATRKIQSFNTVAILSQHIHYYIQGILNVYTNGKLEIKDQYSFDFPPISSQKDWERFKLKFWEDTKELAQCIERMTEKELLQVFVDKKYGDYSRNINAMIEHAYYHLGQLVLIKKMIV